MFNIDNKKIGKVVHKEFINKSIYHASTSEMDRTRDFVEWEHMQLSRALFKKRTISYVPTQQKHGHKSEQAFAFEKLRISCRQQK